MTTPFGSGGAGRRRVLVLDPDQVGSAHSAGASATVRAGAPGATLNAVTTSSNVSVCERLRTKCGHLALAASSSKYALPVGKSTPAHGGRSRPYVVNVPDLTRTTTAPGCRCQPDVVPGGIETVKTTDSLPAAKVIVPSPALTPRPRSTRWTSGG